jgi:hypothetical protein
VTEDYKLPSISPFDFVNSIHHTKENLIVDDWSEKQYNPFIVNKALSFGADTVIYANEMNSRPHIPKKLQYDFLINTIKPKKRYNKWLKGEKVEAIEVIKAYYGYSTEKAHQVCSILSPACIKQMKERLRKGGLKNE